MINAMAKCSSKLNILPRNHPTPGINKNCKIHANMIPLGCSSLSLNADHFRDDPSPNITKKNITRET